MKGRISEQEYDRQYEALETQLRDELQRQKETAADYEHIVKMLSGNWIDIYNALDPEHKNAFWKKVVKEIVLNKETHKIESINFMPFGCGN